MRTFIFFALCAGLLLFGCKSAQQTDQAESSSNVEMPEPTDPENQLDIANQASIPLAQRISKMSGMALYRGVPVFTRVLNDRSIPPNQKEPLYVVNGYPLGKSYRQAASTVGKTEVQKINTLFGAEASSKYGGRSSTGVVEITTF